MIKKVDKSCKTCEWKTKGEICINHGSYYDYGSKISDFDTQRSCWSIGFDYFNKLLETLPEETQYEINRGFKKLNKFYEID